MMQDNRGIIWEAPILREQAEIAELLAANQWIFAKTMPKKPHWYTLRKNWRSSERFTKTVQSIRYWGSGEFWWRRLYQYWDVNGYHYWSMGYDPHGTELINRKPTEYRQNKKTQEPSDYDDFKLLDTKQERIDVLQKFIDIEESHSVLDVGCGAGEFLDYNIPYKEYLGMEMSTEMFDEAKSRHPTAEFLQCAFYHARYWQRWDRILMLFGAPNYIASNELWRIPSMLTRRGKAILMWFNHSNGHFGRNDDAQQQYPCPLTMDKYFNRSRCSSYDKLYGPNPWRDKYLIEVIEVVDD